MHKAAANKRVSVNNLDNRINKQSLFKVTESYKTIRANLLFTLSSAKRKVVLFSSAEPGAGKSITCANLAITMAETNASVLLIDADMRKPVQHRAFHVSNRMGLSTILSGQAPLENCIIEDKASHIYLIPSGHIPPNPAELLSSKNMENLLTSASQKFDYVFVDMPPVGVVSDCLVLTAQAAGVLLVCRQKQTTYPEFQRAIDSVKKVNGTVLGVILNDVKEENKPYAYRSAYKSYDYEYRT